MPIEAAGGDLPWMVSQKEGKKHMSTFTVNMKQNITKDKNEMDWSCYMVKMTDLSNGEDDGVYEIPFWAMKPFAAAFEEGEETGDKTCTFEYIREEGRKGNEAVFSVE